MKKNSIIRHNAEDIYKKEHKVKLAFEQISNLLNSQKSEKEEYAFSLEERQLAAKASSDTWQAILNNEIKPFDFKK